MIFIWAFIVAFFLSFDQSSQSKCGVQSRRRLKVLNGQTGYHVNIPWAVALVSMWGNKPWNVLCSGTLISTRHVVTAAHCLYAPGTNRQYSAMHVVFGDDIHRPLAVLTEQHRHIHPNYDPARTGREFIDFSNVVNDIAIIELTNEVTSSVGVPICLTHWQGLSHRFPHTGYGFGHTPYKNSKLYYYKTTYVNEYSGRLLAYAYLPDYGMKYPIHVCRGDSGGGLSFTHTTGEEIFMGITSGGPTYNCNQRGKTNYQLWRNEGSSYCDVRYHYKFICKYARVGC